MEDRKMKSSPLGVVTLLTELVTIRTPCEEPRR